MKRKFLFFLSISPFKSRVLLDFLHGLTVCDQIKAFSFFRSGRRVFEGVDKWSSKSLLPFFSFFPFVEQIELEAEGRIAKSPLLPERKKFQDPVSMSLRNRLTQPILLRVEGLSKIRVARGQDVFKLNK